MALAARIADESAHWGVDQIFIDGGGVGGGVVDRCRQMGLEVVEVQFGARSDRSWIGQDRSVAYANKRGEIWGSMKEWLRDGAIDADPELIADPAALNTAMCSATAATRFSWSGKRT